MKLSMYLCISLILCTMFTTLSYAQEPERHILLQRAMDEKNVKLYYMGKAYGMDAWALEGGENVQYAYSTAEGGIVFGLQFGPDGTLETSKQIQTLQGKIKENHEVSNGNPPSKSKTEQKKTIEKPNNKKEKIKKNSKSFEFYKETENTSWISIGDKNAPYIYVYINVACDHCHEYWKKLKSAVDTGTIQVRLIPFGRVDINRDTGAALLSVSTPEKAWDQFVDGNKQELSNKKGSEEAYEKIDRNSHTWAKWKLGTSPFTVYKSTQDNKIKIVSGLPDNVLLLLSEMIE